MIGPITGIISARGTIPYSYFTTVLYPFVVDDALAIGQIGVTAGLEWTNPGDDMSTTIDIISGSLNSTVVYINYDIPIEDLSISNDIISGSLATTIAYIDYNNPVEDLSISNDIISGSLNIVIEYISYSNWTTEDMLIGGPTIISGTLS